MLALLGLSLLVFIPVAMLRRRVRAERRRRSLRRRAGRRRRSYRVIGCYGRSGPYIGIVRS